MKSLVVNIPDNLDMDTLQLTRFLATTLYEKGDLTLAQAAEMAGMTIWEFPEVLTKLGLPFFNYTSESFNQEFRFPMNLPEAAGLTEQSLREYLAAKLYGDGTLSLSKAAEMAGM